MGSGVNSRGGPEVHTVTQHANGCFFYGAHVITGVILMFLTHTSDCNYVTVTAHSLGKWPTLCPE